MTDWREKYLNKVTCGDCLDLMRDLPDGCVDAVVTDPPYNISKASWDKIKDYDAFMHVVFKQSERVLKENGSFYWFHNDMQVIARFMEWIRQNTEFVFKQMIVWNKRFESAKNKGFLDGFVVAGGLRNYQQMAEYCLFYTFQDETGLATIFNSKDCFASIKNYLRNERKKTGLTLDEINKVVGTASMAGRHYFSDSQWCMPIEEHYKKLQTTGYFSREYEDLRREYEDLRREYEDLRYTFNNQKTHHSVWNYEIAPRCGHATPKPINLMENIILHSTNEGDIIADWFAGTGTTGKACKDTGRQFIGFEIDPHYCEIANRRIADEQAKIPIPFKEYAPPEQIALDV
jgi:site-specific DNA-methyltransferase (adenine-specific)